MAKEYAKGSDAASKKPEFIPEDDLLPRDNSGGPEFSPYTAEFGDGGKTTGGGATGTKG